jgi:protein TonB
MNTPATPAAVTPFDRLGLTLFFAVALHVALILGVGFDIFKSKPQMAQRTLEIMVVQAPRKDKEPEQADFLAQTSQEGGGTLQEKAKPQTEAPPTPLPGAEKKATPSELPKAAPAPVQQPAPTPQPAAPPPQPKRVITVKDAPRKQPTSKPAPPAQEQPRLNPRQLLASINSTIKQLNAEISDRTEDYAKRPRRKFINASTKEYRYASYLDAWRRKVERIGNLNYPDEARRSKLYGNLVLQVAVRADGSVERVLLLRSSGHKLLDDAAERIVRLAAPYAPFPAEIREETDILEITRTWQFLSNDRFGG